MSFSPRVGFKQRRVKVKSVTTLSCRNTLDPTGFARITLGLRAQIECALDHTVTLYCKPLRRCKVHEGNIGEVINLEEDSELADARRLLVLVFVAVN